MDRPTYTLEYALTSKYQKAAVSVTGLVADQIPDAELELRKLAGAMLGRVHNVATGEIDYMSGFVKIGEHPSGIPILTIKEAKNV